MHSLREENISVFSHMVLCQYYDLWWQPSWISDRHKKPKLFRGPSNDYSWAAWFQLSKWFKLKLSPAVAAILNFISEQKT